VQAALETLPASKLEVRVTMAFPFLRLRRLRQHPALRDLIRETELNLNDLIVPLIIKGETGERKPVGSMPGVDQIPIDKLSDEIKEIVDLGLSSVLLFGVPPHKDAIGSDSYHDHGIIQKAIRKIREIAPHLLIITDVCFCEYMDHGHCGILSDRSGKVDVDNDRTLELLVKQAVSQAQAGSDVVAPSGMIDGMVKAIRAGLDANGFEHIPIFSYSVKYHTCLYGPFRDAAEGAPSFGDRSTHQMDIANAQEALRETHLDVIEGADMLMVKPAHTYLDVIYRVKQAHPHIPLGAYHTSGEYCMLKAAVEKGWLDEKKVAMEVLKSIRRAGADFIITYYAKQAARWLRTNVHAQAALTR
jgi:porphobilinogen synthase